MSDAVIKRECITVRAYRDQVCGNRTLHRPWIFRRRYEDVRELYLNRVYHNLTVF